MIGLKKTMDHAAYQKALRYFTPDMLRYLQKDAQEAAEANPDGENAGYYTDEAIYAAAELTRRAGDNRCPRCGNDPDAKKRLNEICTLVMDVSLYLNAAFEDAVPAQKKLRTLAGLALTEMI